MEHAAHTMQTFQPKRAHLHVLNICMHPQYNLCFLLSLMIHQGGPCFGHFAKEGYKTSVIIYYYQKKNSLVIFYVLPGHLALLSLWFPFFFKIYQIVNLVTPNVLLPLLLVSLVVRA